MEVGDLARDVERHDLPLAFGRGLAAADIACDDRAGAHRAVAFAHDVLVGPEIGNLHGQAQERGLLLLGERGDALHLADERVVIGMKGVHDGLPCLRREHEDPQPSAPMIEWLMMQRVSHIVESWSLTIEGSAWNLPRLGP
jgi:hypothetical protein